jgi:hypothetical protein
MEERLNDIRVRCRLNILRLYPSHRQAQLNHREDFNAWKTANVEHKAFLEQHPDEDIDEGWPCPHAWKARTDKVEAVIDELEEVKAKIDDTKPPEELAGFFDGKPHGIAAADMLRELNDLTNLVQMKLATDEQREKQRILSRHAPYLRSKAVDLV